MISSGWRGFFLDLPLERIIKNSKVFRKLHFKVYSRRSTIIPYMFDKIVHVYNGKKFVAVSIKPEMVGSKYGEYALTKKLGHSIHDSKRNRKRRAKVKKKR